jgi:hypothetical protein
MANLHKLCQEAVHKQIEFLNALVNEQPITVKEIMQLWELMNTATLPGMTLDRPAVEQFTKQIANLSLHGNYEDLENVLNSKANLIHVPGETHEL